MNLDLFRRRLCNEVLPNMKSLQKISSKFGTNSALIQQIINLATSCLKGTGESYFEVGSLYGSSLEAASFNNDEVLKYGCDLEIHPQLQEVINNTKNLKYHHGDFFDLDLKSFLGETRVGVYFFDGPHDRIPSIKGLEKIIPYLADNAVVLYDDCDGYSRAFNAWRTFMKAHSDEFTIVHEFWTPDQFVACTKGDKLYWDGFAIAEFERGGFKERDETIEEIAIGTWHATPPYEGHHNFLYPPQLKHIHNKEFIHVSQWEKEQEGGFIIKR